jgi:isopenicillin-N epimerase
VTSGAATEQANDLWGPDWPSIRARWDLDPGRAHLNHGSFGAAPRVVREDQASWQRLVDANPMHYYREVRQPAVIAARQAAADFLHVPLDELALIANATAGVSTVLSSLALGAGDEIVLTDHAYGAVRMAAERFAAAADARVVTVKVDVTATGDEVVDALERHLTQRTRLVLIDQVTSPTARRFPVRRIAESARACGAATLVDGAHVPGMVDVDVASLGADFWVGNFHKWAFAAHTVAALWVGTHWRHRMRPLVVSWDEAEGYPGAFDHQGTLDYSAWLSLPTALRFIDELGADRLHRHNRALVQYGEAALTSALRTDPVKTEDHSSPLSMRIVPLPQGVADTDAGARALYAHIATALDSEVAVVRWSGRGYLRLSAQVYNAPTEYDRLAHGLASLLR